jgi:hypothetical protein
MLFIRKSIFSLFEVTYVIIKYNPLHLYMLKKVAIVGAGISSLIAAYQLCEENETYDIDIYESASYAGGKAYGYHDDNGLPVEHSMRVLIKYDVLFGIMKKIPYSCDKTIFDNVKPIDIFIKDGAQFYKMPDMIVDGIGGIWNLYKLMRKFGLTIADILFCLWEGLKYRFWPGYQEYLKTISFEQAMLTGRSDKFVSFMKQFVEILVAAKISASAYLIYHLMFSYIGPLHPLPPGSTGTVNMFNGPTSERFIDPLVAYLKSKNVKFHFNSTVSLLDNGTVTLNNIPIVADAYLFGLSLSAANKIFPNEDLPTITHQEWTNGVQLYLRKRPLNYAADCVVAFIWNTPWRFAISIQDSVLWDGVKLPDNVGCVASTVVSNVNNPGLVTGKPLINCTPDEVIAEIVKQCDLDSDDVVGYRIDPALSYDSVNKTWTETMPLFVPHVEDVAKLNDGTTKYSNIFLVGEFTNTALFAPSMEKATQAGIIGAQKVQEYLSC